MAKKLHLDMETRAAQPGGREVRSFGLQIKATGEDGTIEGYGSVFGVLDDWQDVIERGAFAASLKAHKAAGTMPAMLWQHEADEPIGIWTEMTEDAKGLRVKGLLCLETTKGKEAHALMKMGALNGLSIGFMPVKWAYDEKGMVRNLQEVDLWEVSPVTFPANGKARVTSVKAAGDVIQTIRQAEHALRDAGYSADEAKAFIATMKRIALDERDVRAAAAAMQAADRLLLSLTTP